ncbi:MAG TPA: iron ABC transporter permease [Chloroflexota bacterium]|nr:iron ABC transporter permease [Chloroflexota bacterium]
MAQAEIAIVKALAKPAFSWRAGIQWAFLLLITAIILAPVAMVTLGGFNVARPTEGFRFGFDNWARAWADPQVWQALWNSISIVTIRGILGFAIAIPLAWLVARTNIPGAKWLEFGFWVAFFMPSMAYIQGWVFLLEGGRGLLNQWFTMLFGQPSPIDVYSYWGIIWVHLMAQNVSALFILLVLGFRNMDASLEEVARTCGASRLRTLLDVTLPLSRPMLAMLVVLAIIRGMQSYEVEQVLGQPAGIQVYSTLVVRMLSVEPPRIPEGTALSTLVLISLIPLILLQRLYIGRRQYTTVSSKMRTALVDLGRLRWIAFGVVFSVVMLQTFVPFVATVAGSLMRRWGYFTIASPWTLERWQRVLGDDLFIRSLLNTLFLGVISGITAAIVCFLIAYVLIRTQFPGRDALDFVSWLPWAIPGVLLSLGLLTLILMIPPLRILHGSMLMLVIAMIMFRLPLGVHLLKTGFMQINRELEEASTICGGTWLSTQLRIILPILMPMLIAVALMTFVTAVNEVSGVVLLASTETRTLSLLSLGYLLGAAPQKEAAAVVTTIMILLCVGVALIARAFGLRLAEGGLR